MHDANMACTIEDITDQFDPCDFDKALGDLLVGHEGDVEKFLLSIFDFLKRKTNFLKEADAKRRVLEAYKQVAGEADGLKGGFFGSNKSAGLKPAPNAGEQQVNQVRALLLYAAPRETSGFIIESLYADRHNSFTKR